MEERRSVDEDTIEEMDILLKENIKSNKSLTENTKKIWDTMKKTNQRIMWVYEWKKCSQRLWKYFLQKYRRKLS